MRWPFARRRAADPGAPDGSRRPDRAADPGAPDGSRRPDRAALEQAVADRLGTSPDALRVETGPDVPGLIVFSAYGTAPPHPRVTGTFDGGLRTDFDDNVQHVLAALGFGGPADPAPQVVAAAVGMLEGNPGAPFLDQFAIDQGGDPATMFLPRPAVVDGRPAVEYWNVTASLGPWRSQVIAMADGTYQVRRISPD